MVKLHIRARQSDAMFRNFNRMHDCDRQTDGQTDKQTDRQTGNRTVCKTSQSNSIILN